jgi:hypothetical protein
MQEILSRRLTSVIGKMLCKNASQGGKEEGM